MAFILYWCSYSSLDYGGAPHFMLLWAKNLCKNGVSVCVCEVTADQNMGGFHRTHIYVH